MQSGQEQGGPALRMNRLPSRMRWFVFAAAVVAMDVRAVIETAETRFHFMALPNNYRGGVTTCYYFDFDVSYVESRRTSVAEIARSTVRPMTLAGLWIVWSPVVAGLVLTLLSIVVARSRTGRWLIADAWPTPMTTRGLMILVALVGIEIGLVVSTIRSRGRDPVSADWTPILFDLGILHAVAFTPAGIAVLHRRMKAVGSGPTLGR